MGVVYKARQLNLNRIVALKMIRDGSFAGSQEVARFKAEAEAVARLDHPNIMPVYEYGECGGLPFFSMALVEGGSLQERLARDQLLAHEAARWVEKLARAIHYAHEHGVVHRDLKPANVLWRDEGVPVITDFGLAKRLDREGSTATGDVMGTPAYMAPEQAQGRRKEVGPATDIYALGAILYELLTGHPPFRGQSVTDVLFQVIHEDPVPPSRLSSDIPSDLEVICLKCLEKDPTKRYVTAESLAEDLWRFAEGEPISALALTEGERLVRRLRRRGYELQRELGRGPNGVVYEAVRQGAWQRLALKVFWAEHCAEPEWQDRFRAGARAWADLSHPYRAQTHEANVLDGRPYLARELVGGENLVAMCATPQPIRRAVELVAMLARTIRHAHENGLVHSNLRPTNVLLAADGIPRITDGGLPLLPLQVVGTASAEDSIAYVAYRAPEQVSEERGEAGQAADIYALGAILYALITGRPPILGQTLSATLDLIRSQEPTPPSRERPEIPARLDAVCLKCLDKDPQRRFQSAGALVDALQLLLDGELTLAKAVKAKSPFYAILQVTSGPDQGRMFPVGEGQTLTVGRGKDSDTHLTDTRVSRLHCQVKFEGGHCLLTDLGGVGGTRINGKPLSFAELTSGDCIQIGQSQLCFRLIADRDGPTDDTAPLRE